MGIFLKTFAKHLSAFTNLCVKCGAHSTSPLLVKFAAHRQIASNLSPNCIAVAYAGPGLPTAPILEGARLEWPCDEFESRTKDGPGYNPSPSCFALLCQIVYPSSERVCNRLLLMASWPSMSILLNPGRHSPVENSSFQTHHFARETVSLESWLRRCAPCIQMPHRFCHNLAESLDIFIRRDSAALSVFRNTVVHTHDLPSRERDLCRVSLNPWNSLIDSFGCFCNLFGQQHRPYSCLA